MHSIPSTAEQAVALWEELTGKAVHSSNYSFRINGDNFDLYTANKRVQEALAIADDLTVGLIIKTLAGHFAESEKFTLADILNGNARLQARIDLVQRMNAFFAAPETVAQHENFYRYCEGAIAHYRSHPLGDLDDATKRFVRDSGCFVGLDAYHGVNKLTRLMICDGPTGEVAEARVNQFIFAFLGVEDLISHAMQIPTGFSLCVILAPHISDSYFAMVVRNGQRILLLTDKGNYTHPLQEERMRSRNDRYNLNRIESSHFPYKLLDIVWGDNGRQARKSEGGRELAVSDEGLRVLGSLSDLDNWDLLWLHLFIDQCRHRYFEQQQTEPRLAVGSMICLPHKWQPEEPRLPVPSEFELNLETRTSRELTTAFMHSIESEWKERYNPNIWMEERFADQVPDEALYIPGGILGNETPLLNHDAGGGLELTLRDTGDIDGLSYLEKKKLTTLKLHALEKTALSTPERVVRDAHFIARTNQVEVIKRLAEKDFHERKGEIERWWYESAAKNVPNIIGDLLALNHCKFHITTDKHKAILRQLGGAEPCASMTQNLRVKTNYRDISLEYTPVSKQFPPRKEASISLAKIMKLEDYTFGSYRCAVEQGEEAQLFFSLTVSCVLDLMNIAGLPIDQIPPELHHIGTDSYQGNSILDRIDPLAHARSPWDKLNLHFRLPVSLKAFKAYRRKHGLEIPKATELADFASETGKDSSQKKRQNVKVDTRDAFGS